MASDDPAGKRHPYGPRPLAALMPAVTRPAFRKRSPAATQIMTDWAEIVGPALAAVTSPRRLQSGTLTVACSGPIALELQHLTGPLMERINGHLGRVTVERLRFAQDLEPATRAAPDRAPPPADPVDVPGVPPGPLRDALAALGAAVGQRRRRDGA
jgi:hypothetical protein